MQININNEIQRIYEYITEQVTALKSYVYLSRLLSTDIQESLNGILLSHKKEQYNAICSNMDPTTDDHTKWSQSEKDKYRMTSPIGGNLKKWYKWTFLQNKNRLTDIKNRLVVAKGEGGGGGMEWEFGINRCKLVYTGWINHKVLL